MNSIVQCLNATTPLSSYFISGTYIKDVNLDNPLGMKGEIAEEFGFVIKSLWSGQYRSIAPYDFKLTISQFAPQFSGSQQQDSQELMAFLLDGLHEDLNRVIVKSYVEEKDTTSIPDVQAAQISWTNHLKRNNSIIVDMFQGQFRNTMICLSCRKQSVTFQAFMYLSLPLPSSHRCSLTDCLEFFRRREKVSGEDKWYCPHCKQLREASKQLEIWKLPRILLIHLKRFSFKGLWRQKLNTDVSFPISALNVNNYVAGPDMPGNYDLYAVSNHTGDLNGGHYTAYCRNPFNRKWYTFDDKDVSEKSESGVRVSS
jgi:ubiquitin carboxyl-terminal hydrolase 8